jgi:TolB-like protein/DNA-binding winged helix-turn-helix (wHTH) protein/lipopolysaccharide biosynthesis regulator YciM
METANKLRLVKFGDYVADLHSFELRKHGIRLKLQDQPFQILKLLLERPGQLVTREQFRAELWTQSTFVDFDAGLNAAIRRLRDALNDSPDAPRFIETLPRHGYRFIAPVENLPNPPQVFVPQTSAGPEQRPAVLDERSVSPSEVRIPFALGKNSRTFLAAIVITVSLILIVALRSESARRRLFVSRAPTRIQSIAVLPFENLSSNASEQYFADAMTDALITNLSQVGSLKVTSHTSVAQFKESHPSLSQIAQQLHVDSVIEGTIVRDGNRVRITAQLIDAGSDRHLWAKRYDRDFKDILSIQADVATQIASEVQANLTPSEKDRLSQARTVNEEAYEAYLKARYFYQKEDEGNLAKAKAYYLKSINLDPSFAPAYTGLAENYAYLAFMRTSSPDDWREATRLLEKSLELDPNSAPAHALLGMVLWQFNCDVPAAEKEFARALQLNPGDMFTRDYYSFYLLENGRVDEAVLQKRQVLARDPVSVRANAELGLYYLDAKRYDEAIQQLQLALELDPNYFPALMRLGFAFREKKQYDQAIFYMKRAVTIDDIPRKYEYLGEVYALADKREEALATIDLLKKRRDGKNETAVGIALIYADLGENEVALAWLEKAKLGDEIQLSNPGFDGLRSLPGFQSVEGRLRVKAEEACPRA